MFRTIIRLPSGRAIPLRDIYESRDTRHRYLRPFHRSDNRCVCLCNPAAAAPLQLVVRFFDEDYRLACYQGTTAEHNPQCAFYSPRLPSIAQTSLDAVEPRGDGGLYVRLEHTLDLTPVEREDAPAHEEKEAAPEASKKRNTVKLLGLLNILWEWSGLHRWVPLEPNQQRRYSEVQDRLTSAAESIEIPAGRLGTRFYTPPPTWDQQGEILKRTCQRAGRHQAVLVSGQFLAERPTASGKGHMLNLVCMPKCGLFVDTATFAAAINSYGDPVRTERQRSWILAACTLTRNGLVVVHEIVWLHCSPAFIPVHSSHELELAELLVRDDRAFTKPLRYQARNDSTFPDFVLHDADIPDQPMEVWGLDDPDYLARMERKRALYGPKLWEWPAYQDRPIPPLPRKRL